MTPCETPRDLGPAPTMSTVTEASLSEAFHVMGAEMLGFARKSLVASGLAEDAVQETFARAWRSRRRFDATKGTLRTWLFTIERRVIIDIIERQARISTELLDDSERAPGLDGLEQALESWQVEAAMARLHPDHRRVIDELYFKDRSGPEVAALLDIPEGTVRSRAFYALRSLRVLLNEEGWER